MQNKVTKQKLEEYFKLTSSALEKVKKNVAKEKSADAKEIIEMVSNYLSDANYFKKKNNFVNAYAAINYAHGWLDSGVRLKIFKVKDK